MTSLLHDRVEVSARYDRMFHRFGLDLLGAVAPRTGDVVLDVGCGTGAFTVEVGRWVGTSGWVLGVDQDPDAIDIARRRAPASDHVDLVVADAAVADLGSGRFDLVLSRFGGMLFPDPVAAFGHLRRAMAATGRLALVVWRDAAANAWFNLPAAAVARHGGLAWLDRGSLPGPFAFADPERVRQVLTGAGFAGVRLQTLDALVPVGDDLDDALAFFDMTLGARLTGALATTVLERVRTDLRAALEPSASSAGVELPAAAWLVTARAG